MEEGKRAVGKGMRFWRVMRRMGRARQIEDGQLTTRKGNVIQQGIPCVNHSLSIQHRQHRACDVISNCLVIKPEDERLNYMLPKTFSIGCRALVQRVTLLTSATC